MKYVIKDINGNVLFEREAFSFIHAIKTAVREGVKLIFADLSGANLAGANFYNADFSGANLSGANLSRADLHSADFFDADLSGANLSGADLYDSNLSVADLRGANIFKTYMHYVDLRGAKFDAEIPEDRRVVPKEGEFVAWKQCQHGVIVKLLIPADAERSNAFSRKCRASKAVVLEVIGADFEVSMHDGKTTYRVGETLYPDKWVSRWWYECSNGIHFFMTRQEAEEYFYV